MSPYKAADFMLLLSSLQVQSLIVSIKQQPLSLKKLIKKINPHRYTEHFSWKELKTMLKL